MSASPSPSSSPNDSDAMDLTKPIIGRLHKYLPVNYIRNDNNLKNIKKSKSKNLKRKNSDTNTDSEYDEIPFADQSSSQSSPTHEKKKPKKAKSVPIVKLIINSTNKASINKFSYQGNIVRLINIRFENNDGTTSIISYVPAVDLVAYIGSRGSASKLIDEYESPQQKVMLNLVSNCHENLGKAILLTIDGVRRFASTRLNSNSEFHHWIFSTLIEKM